MATAIVVQNQTQSASGVTSLSFDLDISSSSAELGCIVYVSTGTVTSVTLGSDTLSLIGTSTKWYSLSGVTNGTKTVTVNFSSSTTNVRVWAAVFSDVYQTSPFVTFNSWNIPCSGGSEGSWQFIYSSAIPGTNTTPSTGYRVLRGLFPFQSSDGTYNTSTGCSTSGYYGNTPYGYEASFDNTTGTYEKICLTSVGYNATSGAVSGSAYDGRVFQYGYTSTIGDMIGVVFGTGTTISASQLIIL